MGEFTVGNATDRRMDEDAANTHVIDDRKNDINGDVFVRPEYHYSIKEMYSCDVRYHNVRAVDPITCLQV